jgi:hypothetical protein
MKITGSGFKETASSLGSMVSSLKSKAKSEVLEPSLNPAKENAKKKARVKTGFMRDHIYTKIISETEGEYGSEAVYSAPQNYGTSRIRGNYFWSDQIPTLETDLQKNGQKWINNNIHW